jgi:hypothetical protein
MLRKGKAQKFVREMHYTSIANEEVRHTKLSGYWPVLLLVELQRKVNLLVTFLRSMFLELSKNSPTPLMKSKYGNRQQKRRDA